MLNPIEIKKQEFSKAVRGYDAVEVRSFLETIADEVERLNELDRKQSSEVESLKSELKAYQRIEQNMKEALVNAQETLRDSREGAKREAELLLKEAEIEAQRIIREAQGKGKEIKRELETLKARRDSFVRKIRNLLRSEVELIELLDDDEELDSNMEAVNKDLNE